MKLYNYIVRTYRVYIIRRFLLLLLSVMFLPLGIMAVMSLGEENETVFGMFFDMAVFVASIVLFIHNVIETRRLILDLKEGPQSRTMRFIEGGWDEINIYDRKQFWGFLKFRYSAKYEKGKNYREYITLRGTIPREKFQKMNRMGSPRFEVVYFPRSKIMKELK